MDECLHAFIVFFFQAEDGIRDVERSRGLGDVYKRQVSIRHVYPTDPGTGRLHGSPVMTIPRSDRVSTENGWKRILLENVNHFNLNRFGLKRLIEHDLTKIQ